MRRASSRVSSLAASRLLLHPSRMPKWGMMKFGRMAILERTTEGLEMTECPSKRLKMGTLTYPTPRSSVRREPSQKCELGTKPRGWLAPIA